MTGETGDRVLPARPSASVIVLRDGDGLEVLMVRRHEKLVYHGGAWVFPGGRVDAADAESFPLDHLETARRTAVREVHEETALVLDPQALRPLSHWTTSIVRPRRFANWFFVASVPREEEVRVDGEEIIDARWMPPAAALDARARGEIALPPPTFITLQSLAQVCGVAALPDFFERHVVERFNPKIVFVPDGEVALYEGDAGYDAMNLEAPGSRHRLHMLRGGWRYERSR